jgi:hypothetical protein
LFSQLFVGEAVLMEPGPRQHPAARSRPGDFDVAALYAALDEQREARGLSWQGVAREINNSVRGLPGHPLSPSTMAGMLKRTSVEGNCVLLMLTWLGRTPESFVTNHPAPNSPDKILPRTPPDRILRWNVPALHAALEERRTLRGMTWKQVADEISGFTPGMLTGLAKARHIGFPRVMRLVAWLDQPAVHFVAQRSR